MKFSLSLMVSQADDIFSLVVAFRDSPGIDAVIVEDVKSMIRKIINIFLIIYSP
jgi:hypothetical protein